MDQPAHDPSANCPKQLWIFLAFKKPLLDAAFLRCTLVAFLQLHQRSIYRVTVRCCTLCAKDQVGGVAGGRRRPRPSLRWIGSFVIEVQSPGHHFFVYLLCSRSVLSNWHAVGAVNASHMCYFKFSSRYIKKKKWCISIMYLTRYIQDIIPTHIQNK